MEQSLLWIPRTSIRRVLGDRREHNPYYRLRNHRWVDNVVDFSG